MSLDDVEAETACHRHAVVAVLDEVVVADLVDVDRRNLFAGPAGAGEPFPALPAAS
jgi:hypothetical protein